MREPNQQRQLQARREAKILKLNHPSKLSTTIFQNGLRKRFRPRLMFGLQTSNHQLLFQLMLRGDVQVRGVF